MSSSSIFSSESLRLAGARLPRGLLFAVAILAGIEVGLVRSGLVWAWQPPTSNSGVFDAIEARLAAAAAAPPAVVVMGNSRARDGIAPRLLEERLGLADGGVLNIALTEGKPLDTLMLYERHRDVLSKARLLVVNVDGWNFSRYNPPNDRDRRFRTVAERLDGWARDDAEKLVAGALWRTYDAREAILNLFLPRKPLRFEADGRMIWREQSLETGPDEASENITRFADLYYERWEPSAAKIAALERVIALARADGVRVAVLHLPFRQAMVDYLERQHAENWSRFKDLFARIEGADLCFLDRPGALGLAENLFYDYGHVTDAGARIVTRALAARFAPALAGATAAAVCPRMEEAAR
jgi:hypothetical protein